MDKRTLCTMHQPHAALVPAHQPHDAALVPTLIGVCKGGVHDADGDTCSPRVKKPSIPSRKALNSMDCGPEICTTISCADGLKLCAASAPHGTQAHYMAFKSLCVDGMNC